MKRDHSPDEAVIKALIAPLLTTPNSRPQTSSIFSLLYDSAYHLPDEIRRLVVLQSKDMCDKRLRTVVNLLINNPLCLHRQFKALCKTIPDFIASNLSRLEVSDIMAINHRFNQLALKLIALAPSAQEKKQHQFFHDNDFTIYFKSYLHFLIGEKRAGRSDGFNTSSTPRPHHSTSSLLKTCLNTLFDSLIENYVHIPEAFASLVVIRIDLRQSSLEDFSLLGKLIAMIKDSIKHKKTTITQREIILDGINHCIELAASYDSKIYLKDLTAIAKELSHHCAMTLQPGDLPMKTPLIAGQFF